MSVEVAPSPAETPLRQRCLLAVCMFLCVASFGFLEPFVPLFLELNGLQRAQIGLVNGIGTGMALLIQPLLGRLSDRLDARRPLMFAAAVAAGCAYLSYRAADSVLLFIALTTLGCNGIMYLNTANAVLVGRLAGRTGDGSGCGGTFASYRVWGSVGYVVVSLLAGLLLSRGLGQTAITRATIAPLFLYGPLLFFAIAGLVWLLPDPRKEDATPQQTEARPVNEAAARDNLRRFLRAYFLYLFAYTGSAAYLSLYLKSLGATPLWVTCVFAAGVVCEVILMSQVGRLSDRFGRRPLLALAFAFMPVRLLLYIPATSPFWVMGVQTLHGINFGIMVAVAVAFVNDLCDETNRGAMQSRMAATAGLAGALGPAVGGWIAQQWGIRWTFGVMACVAAAGALTFLWKVRESHPRPIRLYRIGPESLRPVLRVLCVPAVRLSRRSLLRRRAS